MYNKRLQLIVDVEQCADSVERWMVVKRLKLNSDKPESLLAGSRRMVSVSQDNHLRVDDHQSSSRAWLKISWYTFTLW